MEGRDTEVGGMERVESDASGHAARGLGPIGSHKKSAANGGGVSQKKTRLVSGEQDEGLRRSGNNPNRAFKI